jgi:hypothetical protein
VFEKGSSFVRLRTEHSLYWLSHGATLCRERVESKGVGVEEIESRGLCRAASLAKLGVRILKQALQMTTTTEYRGIEYSIANNDDGVWRWIIYPKKSRRLEIRAVTPRPTYATRDDAVRAATAAIDALLDEKPARKPASDRAGKQTGDAGTQQD